MSFDIIVFDPTGLQDFPLEAKDCAVNLAMNDWCEDHEEELLPATEAISKLESQLSQLTDLDLLDPYISCEGRYANFNVGWDNFENLLITFHEVTKSLGLVLIDPQAEIQPVIGTPAGDGLLDV